MGDVRAILWQHLFEAGHRQGVPPPVHDPTALVPAPDFGQALAQHGDAEAQRDAGRAYASLWARTFRTLVRHLRGHPERMLLLFVEEFYPYLRGRRLAARIESAGRRRARIVVDDDVPLAYTAGLLEGFVALSGATATVQTDGSTLHVAFSLRATDRARRLARHLAQLRIPLLLMAGLAACVGVAAAGLAGPAPPLVVAAVLIGAVAAQSIANAWQDLRAGPPSHPFASPRLGRRWSWFQAGGSTAVAAACLGIVARHEAAVLAFAALGLLAAASYHQAQAKGAGPAVAGITHGLLIPLGAAVSLHGLDLLATPGPALLLALPTGLLAAAQVHLDDLADRPLDEASGRRTLVVRQVERESTRTVTLLLLGGAGSAMLIAALLWTQWAVAGVALVIAAGAVSAEVRRNASDPAALGPARLRALAVYVAAATLVILALLVAP